MRIFLWKRHDGFGKSPFTTKLKETRNYVELQINCKANVLKSVRGAEHHQLPAIQVVIINKTSGKSFHRIFVKLCNVPLTVKKTNLN